MWGENLFAQPMPLSMLRSDWAGNQVPMAAIHARATRCRRTLHDRAIAVAQWRQIFIDSGLS
jgi:hypothetical protein